MAQRVATKELHKLAGLAAVLRRFPPHSMQVRYDEAADVLYVKFADTKPIYQSKTHQESRPHRI